MSPRRRAYLLLLIVAAIWGFAPPLVKNSYAFFSPLFFLTYRFLITSVLLIPLLLIAEPRTVPALASLTPRDWLLLFITGLLGSSLQLGLLFWGLSLTTSLDSSFISSTSPILVALVGYLFLHEHITSREKLGQFLAFLGTLVIVVQPLLEGQKLFSGSFLGNLLVLAGTFAWAGYVLLTKRELRHKLSPLFLTTSMFFIGLVSLSFLLILGSRPAALISQFTAAPVSAHAAVFYMAFISGALGYWAYQKAQKTIEISEANIFLYLSPLFTIPLSYFWLREPVTIFLLIGSVIIAAGVAVAQARR